MIIVFDIETTGLIKDYQAPAEDVENFPRVIQIAWSMFDEQRNQVKQVCNLIKPDGWVMPTDTFWTQNGYYHEKSLADGAPIKEVLEEFIQDMSPLPQISFFI